MPESISPYALLCASKPKPAPTLVTAYDLYSQAQRRSDQTAAQSAPVPAAVQADMQIPPPAPRPHVFVPAGRTHYIADIKARHSAACRRAPMQNQPLT